MATGAKQAFRLAHPATAALTLPMTGVLATAIVVADPGVPALVPAAGLWLCIGLPTLLLVHKLIAPTVALAEALVYGLATTLLALMLGGLALNQLLPVVGVARPLDRVPVLITLGVGLIGLVAWRFDRRRAFPAIALTARESVLIGTGAIVVVGAIMGAIRLNNGASGAFTICVLAVGAAAVVGLLVWRGSVRDGVICTTLYLLALGLLFMASLRGWYITGHDIQQEFHSLQLTSINGGWDISRYRDPYNACLSITILPTVIGRIAHLHDPYVFKVVFQMLFAVCPVVVYRIARRFTAVGPSVLAAVYFLSFPTFFTDMPFLARQEIAFIFLGGAYLVMTDAGQSMRWRRTWLALMSVGVVFSHYSTTYVLLGVMAVTWLAARTGVATRMITRARRSRTILRVRREPLVITWPLLVGLTVLVAVWTGPLTGTSGQLEKTALSSARGVLSGDLLSNRSSDVSYSLLAGDTEPLSQRLARYRTESLDSTAAARGAGTYYPRSVLDRYPTPALEQPGLPLTAVGRGVSGAGVSVPALNFIMRGGFARLLQVFLVIGLVGVGLGLVRWFRPTHEFFLLAAASFAVVISQILLPALTVEYGLLRSVQQGLFVLAPFLVAGSVAPFMWLGLRRAGIAAAALGVCFYLSLTGVLPSILGGYPAQLHLANSGEYYDLYYVQPQERAATGWLGSHLSAGTEVQNERQSNRYLSSDPATFASLDLSGDDIYPTLLRPASVVFLGESVVRQELATVGDGSDELTYRYPLAMLDATKDLVYSNAGARIYAPPAAAIADVPARKR